MCLIPVIGNELFECTDYCGEGQQACFPYPGKHEAQTPKVIDINTLK